MEALTQIADLRLSPEPAEVLPRVWTTGEILERPEPEGRSLNHFVLPGEGWQPDLYRDDLAMVGERAYVALVTAFGDRVQPCPAGTSLTFA